MKRDQNMNHRTNILYIIDVLLGWAGTEKHLFKLASRLDKDRCAGYVCALRATGEMLQHFNAAGVQTFLLPVDRIYGFAALKQAIRLARFIRQHDIDIVQTFHFSADLFGALVAKLAGVPIVISSKRDTGFLNTNLHAGALRLIAPLVNQTICVSKAVKQVLAGRKLLDPARARVIYNGVDLLEFAVNRDAVADKKKQLGLAADVPVVALVANPRPVKDLETFILAARQVLDAKREAHFIVIGEYKVDPNERSSYREKLDRLAAQLEMKAHLSFLGRRADVSELLAVTDVCVLTSRSEGFSNTIIEYMAAQKPVVATDVGGNNEAVREGETGFLVPPQSPDRTAAAILKLLDDQALAQRMGKKGRERLEEFFTLARMVRDHQELYNALLSGSRRGRKWKIR